MSISFDKRSCLERAKNLLSKNDDSLLRYVCLELRFCLEDITYKKLSTYAKRLPKEVIEKWQPPQAFRALLEFEPYADQNFSIKIREESKPAIPSGNWRFLGTHKIFKLNWLRKTYNQLGSYLHIPSLKSQQISGQLLNSNHLRKVLEEIISELEPIVASTIDSSLANIITFQCSKCKDYVIVNHEGVKRTKRAVCLNPNCSAEYFAEEDKNGDFNFCLMASSFKCLSCRHQNQIENKKLKIGYRFKCEKCGEEHEFVKRQWGYGKIKNLYKDNN